MGLPPGDENVLWQQPRCVSGLRDLYATAWTFAASWSSRNSSKPGFSPLNSTVRTFVKSRLRTPRDVYKRQVEEFLDEVIRPVLEENKDLLGVKAEINV